MQPTSRFVFNDLFCKKCDRDHMHRRIDWPTETDEAGVPTMWDHKYICQGCEPHAFKEGL